jgi:hypothetical protein
MGSAQAQASYLSGLWRGRREYGLEAYANFAAHLIATIGMVKSCLTVERGEDLVASTFTNRPTTKTIQSTEGWSCNRFVQR